MGSQVQEEFAQAAAGRRLEKRVAGLTVGKAVRGGAVARDGDRVVAALFPLPAHPHPAAVLVQVLRANAARHRPSGCELLLDGILARDNAVLGDAVLGVVLDGVERLLLVEGVVADELRVLSAVPRVLQLLPASRGGSEWGAGARPGQGQGAHAW